MKTICMWCGKHHPRNKARPASCRRYSSIASALLQDGVPMWVLMGILHRHGIKALDNADSFEAAAREFAGFVEAKNSLGPLVGLASAKRRKKGGGHGKKK